MRRRAGGWAYSDKTQMGSIRPAFRRQESGETNWGLDYLFNETGAAASPMCDSLLAAGTQRHTGNVTTIEGLTQQAHDFPHYRPSAWLPKSPRHTAVSTGCTRRWCSSTAAPRAAQAPSPPSQRKWLPTPLRAPAANCSQLRVPRSG